MAEPSLSELLKAYMKRARRGSKQLEKLTGVPRTSIDNWRQGLARRPREWQPLVKVAKALALSQAEADRLLTAAGFPTIATLAQDVKLERSDRKLLPFFLKPQTSIVVEAVEERVQKQPHLLRAPAPDFVGRTVEIERLVEVFRNVVDTQSGVAICGIYGMGGVGKTELACMVAHQLRDVFVDGQLFVNLRGTSSSPLTAEQSLKSIIHAVEPKATLPDNLAELEALYRSMLFGKRVLILADDADGADQVNPLFPPAGCVLLVTSRSRFTVPGMITLDLGMLAEAEAQRLLLQICPRTGEYAPALAKLCGYLPLALRVNASRLKIDETIRVAQYCALLDDVHIKLNEMRSSYDTSVDVEASLELSYAKLDHIAQLILTKLSVFPTSFDLDTATAITEIDIQTMQTALSKLRQYSLLEVEVKRRSKQHYRLHDLVRAFAVARLEHADTLELRYAQYYAQVIAQAMSEYKSDSINAGIAGLVRFFEEREQIEAGWAWVRAHAGEHDADELCMYYASEYSYLFFQGDKETEASRLEEALAAAERLGDQAWMSQFLLKLGELYCDLQDSQKGVDYFERALVLAQNLDDQRKMAGILYDLGTAYSLQHRIDRSISSYEQSIEIFRNVQDITGEEQAQFALGYTCFHSGKLSQARLYYEQALRLAQEVVNSDPDQDAMWTFSLLDVGEDPTDEELENASAIGEPSTSPFNIEHYDRIVTILRSLGEICVYLEDTPSGIKYFEQVVPIVLAVNEQEQIANCGNSMQRVIDHLHDINAPDIEEYIEALVQMQEQLQMR